MHSRSLKETLWIGFCFGFIITGTAYYWMTSFVHWAGPWSIVFFLATCLYQTLFATLFAGLTWGTRRKYGPAAALLCAPFFWTALEYLATFGILGVPESIGHGQFFNPILRPAAPVLGVNYLSFLSLAVCSAVVLFFLDHRRFSKGAVTVTIFLIVLMAFNAAVNGYQRQRMRRESETAPVSVVLVRPSISAEVLNDPARGVEVLDAYLNETRVDLAESKSNPMLLLWPEMIFPYAANREGPTRTRLFEAFRNYPGEVLLGGPSHELPETYYNTVFLLSGGSFKDIYEKERLVPFGEYIPYRAIFGFIRQYLPLKLRLLDYSAGPKTSPIHSMNGDIGITICLESLYTDLVRRRVDEGAELLVNFTNDAWFAGSSAEARHFFIGAMRGLENGRTFIQEASVGISGVVDPDGNFLRELNSSEGGSLGIRVERVKGKTLFTRLGLWRFPIFALLTAIMLGLLHFQNQPTSITKK